MVKAVDQLPVIAVIGCGAAACEFFLPALQRRVSDRQRVILVDPSPERIATVARQFNFPRSCHDYRDVPEEVGIAVIATPHRWHAEQALYFLQRGVHVLVEKPLGMNADEVTQLVAAARDHQVNLGVNNYRRLFPAYRRVKELLASRELGEIRRIAITDGTKFAWQSVSAFYVRDPLARGVLLDRGAHTIDILCWWLAAIPHVSTASADAIECVEGLVDLHLECQGIPISVKFSRFNRLENRYTIECERGEIIGRLFDFARFEIVRAGRREMVQAGDAHPHTVYAWQLFDGFLDSVAQGALPPVSGADVAPSLSVIDEAYQQLQLMERSWYTQDPNLTWLKTAVASDRIARASER